MHLRNALSGPHVRTRAQWRILFVFGALQACVLPFWLFTDAYAQDSQLEVTGREKIERFHAELSIPRDYEARTGLPLQLPPKQLKDVGRDMYGRPQRLESRTADAWKGMIEAAKGDGVNLLMISAFRPPEYQRDLLRRKLRAGDSIAEALEATAAPGHSEHQSGRAVDIGCAGCPVLEEEFEDTRTFAWLTQNAANHGFFLSYPRDNPHGVMYEPWHWCYREE